MTDALLVWRHKTSKAKLLIWNYCTNTSSKNKGKFQKECKIKKKKKCKCGSYAPENDIGSILYIHLYIYLSLSISLYHGDSHAFNKIRWICAVENGSQNDIPCSQPPLNFLSSIQCWKPYGAEQQRPTKPHCPFASRWKMTYIASDPKEGFQTFPAWVTADRLTG